jgi:glucose/mannose transport system substrate-binding protein
MSLAFVPGSVLLLVLSGGAGISAAADAAPRPAHRLVLYHSWDAPSEVAALQSLVDRFVVKYPGAAVSMSVVQRDPENLFPILRDLVKEGRAPEACYAHDGYGAQAYFDAGLLQPTDEIWKTEGLERAVSPALRAMCQIDGRYFVVPIGVHRVNLVWHNKALLEKHGIDPAALTTWERLFQAADTLRKKGVASPIVLAESWTATVVFQSIVASLGLDFYERWVNGKVTAPDEPKMLEAFRLFGRYLDYVNADHAGLAWNKALHRVMSGDAAFFLMGDWANGEFRLAGKTYDKEYGAIPAPGTKGMYGAVMDGFALPKGVGSPVNADRWLRLVASREGQDSFNVLKGSIPPRSDADVARYDVYQKSAISELKNARLIFPAVDEAIPDAARAKIVDALVGFMADRDGKKASALFAQAASSLAKEYKRTWSFQ